MNTRISKMLVCGHDRVAALTVDGKVLCHGSTQYSDEDFQCSAVEDQTGSTLTSRVIFGSNTSVIIDAHGNLSAAGTDDYGQASPIANWKGPFVDVVCAFRHSVGLRKDGTVVACGWEDFGQCDVSGWHDITAIAAGLFHTLGLRKDGIVIGCGDNDDHQLDIDDWSDIVSIVCSDHHSVGLKSDGTVVACGNPEHGACNVSDWKNIVKVICGGYHTVGLRNDGTVVACGDNDIHTKNVGGRCDVDSWTDVKDIVCSDYFTLGLRNDGTVLFCGHNNNGVADVRQWSDIVHIVCNELAVFGLKKDGTVVTCGTGDFFSYEPVTKWKLFTSYETIDEDFQKNLDQRIEAAKSKSATPAKSASSGTSSNTSASSGYTSGSQRSNWFPWVLFVLALLAGIFYFTTQPVPETHSPTEPTTAQSTEPNYPVAYVNISDALNLRTAPGQDYNIITTMPNGEKVYVQKTQNGWAYVIYKNYTGWCSADYLDFEK